MDTLGKRFYENFLGYAHCFVYIRISKLKDHSISVDQDMYAKSFVVRYLDTSTIKEQCFFNETTLPHDMIFTKYIILPVINKWN